MAIVNFLEHESFIFSTPEYKTSEKVEKAKEGAVWGMLIGDAIGMPAHWFYKPSDIKTYYDGWLTGYEAPGKHPSSIICITPDGMYKLQPITIQYHILTHQRYIAVENIVTKGEIACNKQFLLFLQCFPPFMALIFHSKCTVKCRLQFISIWTSIQFCRNGLKQGHNNSNISCLLHKMCKSTIGFSSVIDITHSHTMTPFDAPGKQAF